MGMTSISRPVGAPSHEASSSKPRRRVLVVDDDPTIRAVLVRVLQQHGFDVQAAANGVEALDLATRESRPFDLLMTDLMMPLMGGRELVDQLRQLQPEIRVICLSASYSDTWLELSVLFLPKPFSLRAIVAMVTAALEGTRWRKVETA